MTGVLFVAAVVLGVALVMTLVRWSTWRSTLSRRLGRAVLQLDREAPEGLDQLEQLVQRLELTAERTSIERNLVAEERARLQHAINELRIGLVVVDQDGEPVARNLVADRFLESRDAGTLVGSSVVDLLDAARRGVRDERYVRLGGVPDVVVRVNAQPLFSGERPLGAVAVIDDHSESTRFDQARKDFVSNVADEVSSALTGVSMFVDAMYAEDGQQERSVLARQAQRETDRLANTLSDLQLLESLEASVETRNDIIDVDGLLSDAAELARPLSDRREVKVMRLPAAQALRVSGDREQLLAAVVNVVENAIQFSEADDRVEVAAMRSGNWVEIAVRDQGIGIDQLDHERIFDRFTRVDPARSKLGRGTGLGLSIVRRVVANHGGEIRLRSRVGEGTSLTMLLPATDGPT